MNCHIPEYLAGRIAQPRPAPETEVASQPPRTRQSAIQTQQKGLTIVPIKIYFRDGIAKCELRWPRARNSTTAANPNDKKKPNAKPMKRCTARGAAKLLQKRKEDMQIQLESQPYASIEADALVTYVFDREDNFDGVLADINVGMSGRLSALVGQRRTHRQIAGNDPGPLSARARRAAAVDRGSRASRTNLPWPTCARLPAGAALSESTRREENCVSGARRASAARKRRRQWWKGFDSGGLRVGQVPHGKKETRRIQSVALAGFRLRPRRQPARTQWTMAA